jgi:MFS family permease
MILTSIGIAVASGIVGLYISFHAATAAGATIVLTATAAFLICLVVAPNHGLLAGYLARRTGRHHAHHFHANEEAELTPD